MFTGIKRLATAAASVCLATTAHADWIYDYTTSEFDGKKTERIHTESVSGNAWLVLTANSDGKIDPANPYIALAPGLPYICNTSPYDSQFVAWIVVDKSGKEIYKDTLSSWEVNTERKALFPKQKDVLKPYGPAQVLFAYMYDENASEVRFKFTDDCGTESITKFTLSGFRKGVEDIQTKVAW